MMVGKVKRLSNPKRKARKNTGAKKRRRNMSAKQIKHFGTKAQRAALKRRRSTKANPTRKTAKTRVVYRTRVVKAKATKRRTKRRSNPLQMVTLGLVNPRKKGRMTKTKRRSSNPKRRTAKRRNTKVVVLARKNKRRTSHHSARRRSNPSIGGVSGKGVLELVGGGLAGVALGRIAPSFLPAALVSNPLFAAGSVAAIGYFAGMLAGKMGVSRNLADGITYGSWMEAGSMLITNFLPGLNLGLGVFTPAAFNEPDNPVLAGNMARQRALAAAQAAATPKGVGNFASVYGGAY